MDSLTLEPIGYVQTGKKLKFQTPHQPNQVEDEVNYVQLAPGKQFDLALQDLAGFEHIWLVWWFHKNTTWRPRVMPPRGPATRRGVFATRSPHRPNPIGLTSVRLLRIEGLKLTVGSLDLLDGTPILDIKPYIPGIDAHPSSKAGWVDELVSNPELFEINVSPNATKQVNWLADRGVTFIAKAKDALRSDPGPHRTRRILQLKSGQYRMACGPWRLFYTIDKRQVTILDVRPGYSVEALLKEGWEKITDRDAQLAFWFEWPMPS